MGTGRGSRVRRFWHSRARDGKLRLYAGGQVLAVVYGPRGRVWVEINDAKWGNIWHRDPFPDLDSAKRWCERELAFAGLEAIA